MWPGRWSSSSGYYHVAILLTAHDESYHPAHAIVMGSYWGGGGGVDFLDPLGGLARYQIAPC